VSRQARDTLGGERFAVGVSVILRRRTALTTSYIRHPRWNDGLVVRILAD